MLGLVKLVPVVVEGDSVVVVVLAVDSGEAAGLAAGATVSVFCSQATRATAAARMQKQCLIIRWRSSVN